MPKMKQDTYFFGFVLRKHTLREHNCKKNHMKEMKVKREISYHAKLKIETNCTCLFEVVCELKYSVSFFIL